MEIMMATYQQWTQSYAPKVILTYTGVKYNKTCDSKQSGTSYVV